MNEDYLLSLIKKDKRIDDRRLDEFRKIDLKTDVINNANDWMELKKELELI